MTPDSDRFATALVEAGLLVPTPVDGVYGYGEDFALVCDAVAAAARRAGGDLERMRFASVMARRDLERLGYFRNFPQLLGSVHCFCGDEQDHRAHLAAHRAGEDWGAGQAASDLVLIPAACFPVYPALARRAPPGPEGFTLQVEANCFRREPSRDPGRLQSFHMLEFVRVGSPDQVLAFRAHWLTRGQELFGAWGLQGEVEVANDPFFGRAAAVLATAQRRQALKFELLAPVSDAKAPHACMSFNYHMDSFGQAAGLKTADSAVAHTACVGFGLERIALALFHAHGLDWRGWPGQVLMSLGIPPPPAESVRSA